MPRGVVVGRHERKKRLRPQPVSKRSSRMIFIHPSTGCLLTTSPSSRLHCSGCRSRVRPALGGEIGPSLEGGRSRTVGEVGLLVAASFGLARRLGGHAVGILPRSTAGTVTRIAVPPPGALRTVS